jgi:argininosuccinate lyase
VVARLGVNAQRSGRAASGLLLATDVADYLTLRGMPFRTAHEVVGAMVRRLLAEGRDFADLSPQEWRQFSDLFGADAAEAATATASVAAKKTPQSTSPGAVAAALADCQAWVAAVRRS